MTRLSAGMQVKVKVARKSDALIEAGGEGEERLRLHRLPLEALITMYSFYAALAGSEGEKWQMLTTKEAEDQVLSMRGATWGTILHWAARDESRAKLAGVIAARHAVLVNATNKSGDTPLHHAATRGSDAVARTLLAAGADKEAQDAPGRTPLHVAAMCGKEAVARALLEAGADKDAKDNDGVMPLHYAQKGGHKALVALLS